MFSPEASTHNPSLSTAINGCHSCSSFSISGLLSDHHGENIWYILAYARTHALIKDGTNIRFVFEISNIRTFSRYSIRFEISKFAAIIEHRSNIFFHECPPPQNWSRTIFYFLLLFQTIPHIYVFVYTY